MYKPPKQEFSIICIENKRKRFLHFVTGENLSSNLRKTLNSLNTNTFSNYFVQADWNSMRRNMRVYAFQKFSSIPERDAVYTTLRKEFRDDLYPKNLSKVASMQKNREKPVEVKKMKKRFPDPDVVVKEEESSSFNCYSSLPSCQEVAELAHFLW